MTSASSEQLRIGDYITLYCNATDGYVANWQSNASKSNVYIFTKQGKDKPENVSNPHYHVFQVLVPNRYKLYNKYKKALRQWADVDSQEAKTALAEAKARSEAEAGDNVDDQKRMLEKPVFYGDSIQLMHMFTGKFIQTDITQTSGADKNNPVLYLDNENGRQAQFKILPRYKVKAEREPVQFQDQIIFGSVKSAGQFFHASSPFQIDRKHFGSELNMGVDFTGFTLIKYYRPCENDNFIRSGSALRLFHKVQEAYLVAEGLGEDDLRENVHLRVRPVDMLRPQSIDPSTSAITYWQIIDESSILKGEVLLWNQPVRLRHMTTGLYLSIDAEHEVTLKSNYNDASTVFRLHAITKGEGDEMRLDSYARIEHIVSERWLHANEEVYERLKSRENTGDSTSLQALTFGSGALRKIASSDTLEFSDAYTLQIVAKKHLEEFNYVYGCIPFLQNLILNDSHKGNVDARDEKRMDSQAKEFTCQTFTQMKEFMVHLENPVKSRQKLFRHLQIVDLIVTLLHLPTEGKDELDRLNVFSKAFDVLQKYLEGPSRRNKLYFLHYLDFFQNQFVTKGDLGLKVAQMLVELIRDNRRILDRITHEQIERFVGLAKSTKNFCYLDLLSVLCVCNGVSIPDNQRFITENLILSQPNGLPMMEIGSRIGRTVEFLYISTDGGFNWLELHECFNFIFDIQKQDRTAGEMKFLLQYLDLIKYLCYGVNEYVIKTVTCDQKYVTWELVLTGIRCEKLPYSLRAKYCELLTVLFIDAGAMPENKSTCFVYEEERSSSTIPNRVGRASIIASQDRTDPAEINSLKLWIFRFLEESQVMVATEVGHNKLVEKVLNLLYHLIRSCRLDEDDDVHVLYDKLLKLLDGKQDIPYRLNERNNGRESRRLFNQYLKSKRFERSVENNHIMGAKYQALQILDLILSQQFHETLQNFVKVFTDTINLTDYHDVMKDHDRKSLPPLYSLTAGPLDPKDVSKKALHEQKQLRILLKESLEHYNCVDSEYLTRVLLDLTKYKYDMMRTKPLEVLNRYYSAKMDMFKIARQAQIERSVPLLSLLIKSRLSEQQNSELMQLLDHHINGCTIVAGDSNSPAHHINQSILINHDMLTLLFDNISSEIDYTSRDQFTMELRPITIRCVHLLKAIAKDNDLVQSRIYDRMDVLLRVKGIESDIALLLKEAFTKNQSLCNKVQPRQLDRILTLVEQHMENVPELLELLSGVVKVIGLGTALRKNQIYVMKHLMRTWNSVNEIFEQSAEIRMQVLLGKKGERCKEYFLNMLDVLSICAEGENRLIDTVCKASVHVDEIFSILSNPEIIDNSAKLPFVVFLNTVFVGEGSEIGTSELAHNRGLWQYLSRLRVEIIAVYKFAKTRPDLMVHLLKTPFPKWKQFSATDVLSRVHATIQYLFEGVLPFLARFASVCYNVDKENYPEEPEIIDKLTNVLMHLCESLKPFFRVHAQVKLILTTMVILLSSSSISPTTAKSFLGEFTDIEMLRSETSDKEIEDYSERYSEEIVINRRFTVFVDNSCLLYTGHNTVSEQIGYDKSWAHSADYTEMGGHEELPLGQEFQKHVGCFIKPQKREVAKQFSRVSRLFLQLGLSAKNQQKDEAASVRQDALDIKSLQILRAMIHNEIVKLPEDWEEANNQHKLLMRIETIQNTMIEKKVIEHVIPLMDSPNDVIVRELLAFISALLFNANITVQNHMYNFFLSTREESFFVSIQGRIQRSVAAVKERRALKSNQRLKVDELELVAKRKRFRPMFDIVKSALQVISIRENAVQQQAFKFAKQPVYDERNSKNSSLRHFFLAPQKPSPSTARRVGLQSKQTSANDSQNGYVAETEFTVDGRNQIGDGVPDSLGFDDNPQWIGGDLDVMIVGNDNQSLKMDVFEAAEEAANKLTNDEAAAYESNIPSVEELEDVGSIELVLKVLAQMCDGQHKDLQDYIQNQPDNIKSVKTVEEVIAFLSAVYSNISSENIDLVIQIFSTLNEFTCGNQVIRVQIIKCKVIDFINVILRSGDVYENCPKEKEFELKQIMGNLLYSLIEENGEYERLTAMDVKDTVDQDAICKLITSCYFDYFHPLKPTFGKIKLEEELSTFSAFKKWTKESFTYVLHHRVQTDIKHQAKNLGFTYYLILRRFYDLDPQLKHRHFQTDEDNQHIKEQQSLAFNFYKKNVSSVEIIKDDCIQKVNFRILNKRVLREEVKEMMKWQVDRTSPADKLRSFLLWYRDISADIWFQRRVLNNPLLAFITTHWTFWNNMMIFLSLLIQVYMLIIWVAPLSLADLTNLPADAILPSELWDSFPRVTDRTSYFTFLYVIGSFHVFACFLVLIGYFLSFHLEIRSIGAIIHDISIFLGIKTKPKRLFQRKRKTKDTKNAEQEDEEYESSELSVKIISLKTLYYVGLLGCSLAGITYSRYFFSLHLLNIIMSNQLLGGVIQAVTQNGRSLIWVAILGLVVFYLYALAGFGFMRDLFNPQNTAAPSFCSTLFQCFVSFLRYGLIGDYNQALVLDPRNISFLSFSLITIYDLSFFIVVTTIGLNIIFGVIVDTFSELRYARTQAEEDMRQLCFICNMDSFTFEHSSKGFNHHVMHEHNMWSYMHYLIYLHETDSNDYTSIDMSVYKKLKLKDHSFFPINRSLSLNNVEQDSLETKLDELLKEVQLIKNKQLQEEAERRRVDEQQRQQRWAKTYSRLRPQLPSIVAAAARAAAAAAQPAPASTQAPSPDFYQQGDPTGDPQPGTSGEQ